MPAAVLPVVSIFTLFITSSIGLAQEIQRDDQGYTVNVDVQLVQLPVSVLDSHGYPVSDIERDAFQVFEDGVPQEISLFQQEDAPVSLGLVIDTSSSMRDKQEEVNNAALTFVKESNPQDETFIVTFGGAAYLEQDFTLSISDLVSTLRHLEVSGETALYDAAYLSLEHLKEGKEDKKTLLLITDGEDNRSKYRLKNVLAKFRESRATVYVIGLLDEMRRGRGFFGFGSSKAKKVLKSFAESTGGKAYFPKSAHEVGELCTRIARDVREQYTLGYLSTNKRLDGSWRDITVRLNSKLLSTLSVRTKEGYYAPTAEGVTRR